MMKTFFKLTSVAVLVGSLAACDSSSSSSTQEDDVISKQVNISGYLVYPESISESAASKSAVQRSTTCSDIPTGYTALSSATVYLTSADGDILKDDITTDSCGSFDVSVDTDIAEQMTLLTAEKDGFKAIKSNIDNFLEDSELKVASTISSDASYYFSGLRQLSDNEINVVITDSESYKAVIGIEPSAFTVEKNNSEITLSSLVGSQSVTDNEASILISLDSSGSMSSYVFDEDGNYTVDGDGNYQSRYSVAAASAHQFVETTKDNDEEASFSMVLFSDDVYSLTDDYINASLSLENSEGETIEFVSERENGFIEDSATVHTLIDIYNPHSEMYFYSSSPEIARYDDREDNIALINTYYPFSGGTAFYDSLDVGLDEFDESITNPQIIVLTDGADNSSSASYTDVITKAQEKNIPISVLAIGSGISSFYSSRMETIATETGSQYLEVSDVTDLSGFFDGLSTQTSFNYNGTLSEPLVTGDVIQVTVEINGESTSRELTIN